MYVNAGCVHCRLLKLKTVPSLCGLDSNCGKKKKKKSKCCLGQFYNVGNQSLSLKTCAVVKRCSALSKLTTHIQTESFLRNANFSSNLPHNLFVLSDLFWANMYSAAYDYRLIPYAPLHFAYIIYLSPSVRHYCHFYGRSVLQYPIRASYLYIVITLSWRLQPAEHLNNAMGVS